MPKTNNTHKSAFIYCRTSTDTQVERGHGIAVQLNLCRDFCKREAILVEAEFRDEGYSGASVDRPGLEEMLGALNGVDYIVVSETSRLWRDIYPQALIQKSLRDAGKDVKAVDEPAFTIYTENDPNQFLINGIMGLLDSWERLVISKRLQRGRRQKASRGQKATGNAPFGYKWHERKTGDRREKVIVVDPEEAETLKLIYMLYIKERSLAGVLKALKMHGINNKRGKPFSRSQIHALLTNPFYKGELTHGELKIAGQHEALISSNLFGRVQNALRSNRKTK